MAQSSAERVAAYRARRKAAGLADSSQRWGQVEGNRQHAKAWAEAPDRPFCGCDGEGAGTDDLDRQLYLLFRMGDRELFSGAHLRTEDILDFICDHNASDILVGFSFGYDVTMILRDMPAKQLERLFQPLQVGEGKSRYTWYKEYDIEYLPKQYFRVRRTENKNGKRTGIKGSGRIIYETFGFFQKSFVKIIGEFDIGTEAERDLIIRNKARRGDFVEMDAEERAYCALECRMLAELMETLRDYCDQAGIKPRTWNGAGKLASAMHKSHKTPRADVIQFHVPQQVADLANMAYYGGRFEITRTGMIEDKVYEYDIRSAYPDAMRYLPCLEHGRWERGVRSGMLYVAVGRFNHPDMGGSQLCGFPVRSREGHLYWPLEGGGVYWSPEIEAAEKIGGRFDAKDGWTYSKQCDCPVFDWLEPLFDYRRSIGSSGPGYPIKLGINSLYGKLAQRKGSGPYSNMVWAGLITAYTRAKILGAVAQAPQDICMIATDGIYSKVPLDLDIGEKLGQWEAEEMDGLFIVQPGLYWSPEKRKRRSRGLPGKFFEEPGRTEGFEHAWEEYKYGIGATDEPFPMPSISVPLTNFIGLKLALARGKPETAGIWREETRSISFDYRNKRDGHRWEGSACCSGAVTGNKSLVSLPHRDFLRMGGHEPWESARAMLEDQPDYVDLGPPFKD